MIGGEYNQDSAGRPIKTQLRSQNGQFDVSALGFENGRKNNAHNAQFGAPDDHWALFEDGVEVDVICRLGVVLENGGWTINSRLHYGSINLIRRTDVSWYTWLEGEFIKPMED